MYQVRILGRAKQDLSKLDKKVAKRIASKLVWLAENFEDVKPEALSGDLSDFFKLRVGDYHVIYETLKVETTIIVHRVGHRREIYKF